MTSTDLAPAAGTGIENSAVTRAGIADLLSRYFVTLDDEPLDDAWAQSLFTEDAAVVFPMSEHVGSAGMAEYHAAALSAFAVTQHHGSRAVVEQDGGRATLRANLISTHVHHAQHARPAGELPPLFTTGTFVDGEARHTEAGWRLSRLSFRLLWAEGQPPPKA
jgi:hypothetical protein